MLDNNKSLQKLLKILERMTCVVYSMLKLFYVFEIILLEH
jgi:hypothetical protein